MGSLVHPEIEKWARRSVGKENDYSRLLLWTNVGPNLQLATSNRIVGIGTVGRTIPSGSWQPNFCGSWSAMRCAAVLNNMF